MAYVRDHWQGRHPLPRAFWLNFALPFVMIAMGQAWMRPPMTGWSAGEAVLASLGVVIAYAVVLPWQIIGLLRSSRRHLEERGDIGVVTLAQGAALIAIVVAAGATVTTAQHIFGFASTETTVAAPSRYRLDPMPEDRAIVIDGFFGVGLTRDLKELLAETAEVDVIVLNSNGGRVFEARGVAKLILENGLDTHIAGYCRSACTTAFIAGKTRTLGENGRLGFHSYRLTTSFAFVDPLEEQEKDKAFFLKQGLAEDFVDHAFAIPHGEMWHPHRDQLIETGVIHEGR